MGFGRRLISRSRTLPMSIELVEGGFALSQGDQSISVRWDDAQRVAAFKRDLGTVDMICIAVELPDTAIELNDDMRGFDEFWPAMNAELVIDPAWMMRVMFPAFATNLEIIFDRTLGSS